MDIAEQVATLDAISHGRMMFGVGLGYRPEECGAYGITMQERVPRFWSYVSELGVNTLVLRVQWPGMQRQQVLEQIRLIGRAVLASIT